MMKYDFLRNLGIEDVNNGFSCKGAGSVETSEITSINPATGEPIARVREAGQIHYELVLEEAQKFFKTWRMVPAPKRGEIIRQLGDELRKSKEDLGKLVSLEMGKILTEGEGEVQEMIDMCDFAVGQSRQLYGLTAPSERPRHSLQERWHPLGVVGVITAFNFPVAVLSWNGALAAVCGDPTVWKPSSETPLCAIAVQNICNKVMERNNHHGLFNLLVGNRDTIGERLIADKRVALISATGSVEMGRHIGQIVVQRFGRFLPELGGNNAVLVLKDADINLALQAIYFGALGTAGQRCTTTRRAIFQKGVMEKMLPHLGELYRKILTRIGDPCDKTTLMGPLINQKAVNTMMAAIEKIKKQDGQVLFGGKRINRPGFFVEPAIVLAHRSMPIVQEETFAPILYLLEAETLEEGIEINNGVPQGLSSSIFTDSVNAVEQYLSAEGSDCGIVNVNVGTSGAEIGLAFGGEKETGGGREAGSDAWKNYMRRMSITINGSSKLTLAQGIKFGE